MKGFGNNNGVNKKAIGEKNNSLQKKIKIEQSRKETNLS